MGSDKISCTGSLEIHNISSSCFLYSNLASTGRDYYWNKTVCFDSGLMSKSN